MGQSDVAGTMTLPGQVLICLLMLFTAGFGLATPQATQVPIYPIYHDIPGSTNSRYYNYAKVPLDIVGGDHKVALTTAHRQFLEPRSSASCTYYVYVRSFEMVTLSHRYLIYYFATHTIQYNCLTSCLSLFRIRVP